MSGWDGNSSERRRLTSHRPPGPARAWHHKKILKKSAAWFVYLKLILTCSLRKRLKQIFPASEHAGARTTETSDVLNQNYPLSPLYFSESTRKKPASPVDHLRWPGYEGKSLHRVGHAAERLAALRAGLFPGENVTPCGWFPGCITGTFTAFAFKPLIREFRKYGNA